VKTSRCPYFPISRVYYIMKKLLILLLFLTLTNSSYPAEESQNNNKASDKEVLVFAVQGNVKVIPMGSNIAIECQRGMFLHPLDWIKTEANSSVTLAFDEKAENVVRVNENSLVIIKLDGYFKIQLLTGKMNAILENVESGETFRALTPSVVTESTSSGWTIDSEGIYSTVVVVDGEAYVCGINKDGTVKKEKFHIKEGYERETKTNEDPSIMTKAPEKAISWFKQQVVQHHLDRVVSKKMKAQYAEKKQGKEEKTEKGTEPRRVKGRNIAIIDGEEVDLLDYLYKGRLQSSSDK